MKRMSKKRFLIGKEVTMIKFSLSRVGRVCKRIDYTNIEFTTYK